MNVFVPTSIPIEIDLLVLGSHNVSVLHDYDHDLWYNDFLRKWYERLLQKIKAELATILPGKLSVWKLKKGLWFVIENVIF